MLASHEGTVTAQGPVMLKQKIARQVNTGHHSKIVCIGRNYAFVIRHQSPDLPLITRTRDHAAELNNVRPKQPFFFLKPASSVPTQNAGNKQSIKVLRPRGVTLHYEVELAVIMRKNIGNVQEGDDAGYMDAIKGKTCDRRYHRL